MIFPCCKHSSFCQQQPLAAGAHVLAQAGTPHQHAWGAAGCSCQATDETSMETLQSSPWPLPCLVWGSGGPSIVLGVLLGAPSLVGHWEGAVAAQSELTRAELGQGPPAKSTPESCPCTWGVSAHLSPAHSGEAPRCCLPRWWPWVLTDGFCLSCQWRTQHTVSSPTCGTCSSGQCPVPRALVTSWPPGRGDSPAWLRAAAALLLHPFPLHPCLPSQPNAALQGWPHTLGAALSCSAEFKGERSSGGVRTHSRIAGRVAPALPSASCHPQFKDVTLHWGVVVGSGCWLVPVERSGGEGG